MESCTPRRKDHGPGRTHLSRTGVQMDQALHWVQVNLRQEFLHSERAKYLEAKNPKSTTAPFCHFQMHSSANRPWEKGTEVVHAPGIRTEGAGRGPKIIPEEIGKQTGSKSITKSKKLFSKAPFPFLPLCHSATSANTSGKLFT